MDPQSREPRFIEVDPQYEITFKPIPGRNTIQSMKIKNMSRKRVAYKIKTTSPKSYIVRPNQGILQIGGRIDIEFTLQYQEMTQSSSNVSDKFMIQAIEVDDGFDLNKFSENASELAKRNMVQSLKLKSVVAGRESNGVSATMATPERGTAFTSPPNRLTRQAEQLRSPDVYDSQTGARGGSFASGGGGGMYTSAYGGLGETQQPLGFNSTMPRDVGKSSFGGGVTIPGFSGNMDLKKECERLVQIITEQRAQLEKANEDRNLYFHELQNLKDQSSKHKGTHEHGFQLWHVILVGIISIIVGAFLSAA
jgi:hypothetical protein